MTPEVGGYYTYCCVLDLSRVETPEEAAELAEDLADEADDPVGLLYFPTLDAALAYLEPDMNDITEADAVELLRQGER